MKNYKIPMNKLFKLSAFIYNQTYVHIYGIPHMIYDVFGGEDYLGEDETDVITISLDYHINHSNDKYMSPFFIKFVEQSLNDLGFTLDEFINDELSDQELIDIFDGNLMTKLIRVIYNRFNVKWAKLFSALNTNYNPLENYDMSETRTPNITKTDTFNTTDTRTPNLTNTENGKYEKDVDSESSLYGFNSSNKNPANATGGNETNTITNHTNVETGTDTNSKTGSITNTETGTETLTRSGNIGVTTSQQMLESEFEVRKHDFYEMMFNDIDSIVCLKTY